jgi:hypothetical protein
VARYDVGERKLGHVFVARYDVAEWKFRHEFVSRDQKAKRKTTVANASWR